MRDCPLGFVVQPTGCSPRATRPYGTKLHALRAERTIPLMLRELHISNLAIIEKVDIEFTAGLNIFTGQTGAGKSLILGALELLLGLRSGGEDAALFVRPGAAEARVTGVFELASTQMADRIGGILDQEIPTGEGVVITRRVLASGRSSVSVNGSPVTATMLREAGQYLVDIHGQHDQQFLLKSANQMLEILDSFAGSTEKRQEFAIVLGSLRAAQHRLAELRQSEEKRRDQLDLYQFQLQEIDSAAPQAGEYGQARSRYAMLKNLEQLRQQTARVLGGLSDGDDCVVDRLNVLAHLLDDLSRMDAALRRRRNSSSRRAGPSTTLPASWRGTRTAWRSIRASSAGSRNGWTSLTPLFTSTPARQRRRMTLSAVLEHRRGLAMKIEQLQSDAQALGTLDRDIEKLRAQLQTVGSALTRTRAAAAKRLKKLVEEQFHELEMHEATFDVSLRNRELDDPGVDSSGLDEIDFMVRTNPGQETLPLRKIASGGEISRIMLALKTILADKDQITVLVFDEIDANIGDRLGATIGRKMRALAHGAPARRCRQERRPHQIICITHLSQIAACADRHLRIAKDVVGPQKDRQTVATVRVLDGQERLMEIAEMLAGKNPTDSAVAHAKGLLAKAQGR